MNPTEYILELPSNKRPDDVSIPEKWYPGIKQYWDRSTTKRIYNPIDGIRAAVIHATAGSSSEGAVSVMMDGKASWHWLVPDENEEQHEKLVWACAPEALAAWHVRNSQKHPDVWNGSNKINHWSVGLEVVNAQKNYDDYSDWQIEVTAQIVRYCWAKYPNFKYVVSHAAMDPKRRTDPGVKFPWKHFEELVLSSKNDDTGLDALSTTPARKIETTPLNENHCCCG